MNQAIVIQLITVLTPVVWVWGVASALYTFSPVCVKN